jgi:hypothetical protein
MYLSSINLGCRLARTFPLAALLSSQNGGPCGDDLEYLDKPTRCHPFGGCTCTARSESFGPNTGFNARCSLIGDPFRGLEIDYDFG